MAVKAETRLRDADARARAPDYTRAEREALGLPCCIASAACPRAPTTGRGGRCRRCFEADLEANRKRPARGGWSALVDPVQFITLLPREQRDQLLAHARAFHLSASEVVRRALTRELGSP